MCIEVFMEKIIQGSGRRESEERGKMVSSNAYENFPSRCERLLLNQEKMPGFLASGGEEFNLESEMRLGLPELLYNRFLLKYGRDRESF